MSVSTIFKLFLLLTITACTSASSKKDTPKTFKEADNTAVFTNKFVIEDKKEITTVSHREGDGAWEFVSSDFYDDFASYVRVVALGQIIKMDSSILEIADMPEGYFAHRNFKGNKWVIKKEMKH